jgi:hypothetical protein
MPTASAAAIATTTLPSPRLLRLGELNLQHPPVNLLTIELLDGRVSFR